MIELMYKFESVAEFFVMEMSLLKIYTICARQKQNE